MGYFSNAMLCLEVSIDSICHALSDPKFDRIEMVVGIGFSGLLLLIPVSLKSGIPCGAVRKSITECHSSKEVETREGHEDDDPIQVNRYVIIDDFIAYGKTITKITDIMRRVYPHSKCVGIILYQDYGKESHEGYPVSAIGEDITVLDEERKRNQCLEHSSA